MVPAEARVVRFSGLGMMVLLIAGLGLFAITGRRVEPVVAEGGVRAATAHPANVTAAMPIWARAIEPAAELEPCFATMIGCRNQPRLEALAPR
jgi:hypothetical protein